jgi:hypothetical protein
MAFKGTCPARFDWLESGTSWVLMFSIRVDLPAIQNRKKELKKDYTVI